MKKNIILIITLVYLIPSLYPCTTAIAGRDAMKDKRALIWKLRDTSKLKNRVRLFSGSKYTFIGIVNSEDRKNREVWAGLNSAGFGIMNSASFNLNKKEKGILKDQEGFFMKKALELCASIDDFRNLLKSVKKPCGLEANFGVIEASGRTAFFETGNYSFTEFCCEDKTYAPENYIIRTNYSYTGRKNTGYGFIRFRTIQTLINRDVSKNDLTLDKFINTYSRSLKHSLLNVDYACSEIDDSVKEYFINSSDLITRSDTASVAVIQGIKDGERPDDSVLWCNIGYPHTSVAIPLLPGKGAGLPEVLKERKNGNCILNEMALELKEEIFPVKRGSGSRYMNIKPLFKERAVKRKIREIELKIMNKFNDLRKEGSFSDKKIREFYKWVDKFILKSYKEKFGIKMSFKG